MITKSKGPDLAMAISKIEKKVGIVKPKGKTEEDRKRENRKGLITYHSPAVIKQLKQIAVDQDTTQQRLVEEALNMLFVKYQRSPIA